MHAIRSFRLFRAFAASNLAALESTEALMNTKLHSLSLDDFLFVVTVFAPVSALLSGALAIVAAG
jgi:hypothetical protein